MGNLQLTLGILGVLAIAGIIVHGLWKIRKGSQQQRQQEQSVAEKRQKQTSSFDDDGIGEVRVLRKAASNAPDKQDTKTASTASAEAQPMPEPTPEEKPSAPVTSQRHAEAEQIAMDLDVSEEVDAPLPSMRVDKDEEVEQAELSLDLDSDKVSPATETEYSTASDESKKTEASATEEISEPEEVIALHVKGSVQGALLLQMMTELGCKFGELGIFHRYENTAGTGELIFSVANMFNPGTFDLDNLENFETEGVAFFMALPMKSDGQQAFNMMLNAAKKLATEIPQGQVLDGQRQMLTRQSIHETRQTIREFERQYSA